MFAEFRGGAPVRPLPEYAPADPNPSDSGPRLRFPRGVSSRGGIVVHHGGQSNGHSVSDHARLSRSGITTPPGRRRPPPNDQSNRRPRGLGHGTVPPRVTLWKLSAMHAAERRCNHKTSKWRVARYLESATKPFIVPRPHRAEA